MKTKLFWVFLALGISLPILFQNCSQVHFQGLPSITTKSLEDCTDPSCEDVVVGVAACEFNGQQIPSGQSITAYLESSGICSSEERTCQNGTLSGSYQYASCEGGGGPKACVFGTQTIPHGGTIVTYQNASSPCTAETRRCDDGVLSGSFQYESCTSTPEDASCIFNGQTIAHGAVVRAFQNSSVPHGETCVEEMRLCTNGSFNGSYQYASCSVGAPNSCLFKGLTIPHGGSQRTFQSSSVPFGETCKEEQRTCDNGAMSGTYDNLTCEVGIPESCSFNDQPVAHGQKVVAFRASAVPYGQTCESQERTCTNGVLDGSFDKPSCNVDQPQTCSFNGRTVAHGEVIPRAFRTSTVPYGQVCEEQPRTCDNGVLSGSYAFDSCQPATPASCTFNNQTIAHGASVPAFPSSTVPYGQQCVSANRICNNGVLSGTNAFASCEVGGPASCSFNGQTIAHGNSVPAFPSSTVPYGQQCVSANRTCNNGVLSGTGAFASCQTSGPANCTFGNQTVNHGATITAWQTATVPWNGTCQSQPRTCTNGVLSGTYTNASCQKDMTNASCTTPWGTSVAHGTTINVFKASTANLGNNERCESVSATCSNGSFGTINPAYTKQSCQESCSSPNSYCLYYAIGRRQTAPNTVNAAEYAYWDNRIRQIGYNHSLLEAWEFVNRTTEVLQKRGLTPTPTKNQSDYINAATVQSEIDRRRQFVFDLLVECSGSGPGYRCVRRDSTAIYDAIGRRMPATVEETEHEWWNSRIRELEDKWWVRLFMWRGYNVAEFQAKAFSMAADIVALVRGKGFSAEGYINAATTPEEITRRKNEVLSWPIYCVGEGMGYTCTPQ